MADWRQLVTVTENMSFNLSYPPMNSIKTFDLGYSKSIKLSAFVDNMSICAQG